MHCRRFSFSMKYMERFRGVALWPQSFKGNEFGSRVINQNLKVLTAIVRLTVYYQLDVNTINT